MLVIDQILAAKGACNRERIGFDKSQQISASGSSPSAAADEDQWAIGFRQALAHLRDLRR